MTAAARQLPMADQPPAAPTRWDWRKYGTLADPIHKSHMSWLVGEYACLRSFRLTREAEVRGEVSNRIAGKTAAGTAGHETIARALRNPAARERILGGDVGFVASSVPRVLAEEFGRATRGLDVAWYGKAEQDEVLEEITAMVTGLLCDLHRHVAKVELVEAGFISMVGPFWTEGHLDLVYRPAHAPNALALTDWKTGATKPHPIVLDHGFESGFYSSALRSGICVPVELVAQWQQRARDGLSVPLIDYDTDALLRARDDRAAMHIVLRSLANRLEHEHYELPEGVIQFGEFPGVIRLTHLRDYIPYVKAGKKTVERAEEIEHWLRLSEGGVKLAGADEEAPTDDDFVDVEPAAPQKMGSKKKPKKPKAPPPRMFDPATGAVAYSKGQQRGPAWYHVRRAEEDIARLEHLLRGIVGWVRMGKFPETGLGEKCTRCAFREGCLTEGYRATGDEAQAVLDALKGIDPALAGLDLG
ncbi:MAG TPA: hypothetical protein VED01_03355 [Burkholderiales bacterium]|nr:hypothetical protein [Burkholderiales bacterium]